MSKWIVKYTKTASDELDGIYRYIAESLLSPEVSARQLQRIMSAISALNDMPMRNPLYDKEPWKSIGLRKLIVDNYIVFYLVSDKTNEIVIMHVFYGGRSIEEILL